MSEKETIVISRFDSIRTRLILAFILIVLLPITFISAVLSISGSEGAQLQLSTQLETVVSFKESAINTWVATLNNELADTLIGDSPRMHVDILVARPADSAEHQFSCKALREYFRQLNNHYDALFVMDRSGRVVLSTESGQEGRIFADQAFFDRGLTSAAVIPSVVDQATTFVAVRPLVDQGGLVVGVLAGRARMLPLAEILRNPTGLGKTGRTFLVGGDSMLLTALADKASGEYVQSEGIRRILDTRIRDFGAYPDYRGIPAIGVYRWLPELGVALVAEQEQAESSHAANILLAVNVSVALAAILIAGFASLAVTRSIAAPLADLSETAAQIAAGRLELTAAVNRHDEIGALAANFNLMTDKLRETMAVLRESEAKYRDIFEHAIEGLFQISFDGRFLSANPAMAHILGYASADELLAEVIDARQQLYVHAQDRETLISVIREHGEFHGFEVEFFRKDLQRIWVSISARMVRNQSGIPLFLEGFLTDISDRRRAEAALAESRNYLDKIIDSAADPIFVKDRQHRWVLANDAFCTFLERSRDEILGKSDYDYFPKDEADVFWAKDEAVFISGLENINEDTFVDRRGNIHAIITKKTLYTDEKNEQHIVGIISDITERKKLEAELRQSQKMETVGLLAGGIAHDFNNLLTPILGYADLLILGIADEDQRRSKLEHIKQAGERARDLTQRLLAFSRKQLIELKTVDLGDLIRKFESILRRTIRENINIEVRISPSLSRVRADAGQIEQALVNLSINAQDAMPEGGTLTIEARDIELDESYTDRHPEIVPGPYVMLAVNDTGIGMEAQVIEHIFEPFYTTKELGKGTGLGLSTVYGIVKQHGGSISVYSEMNHGSIFKVFLPRVSENGEKIALYSPQPDEVARGFETVLVAEDNEMVRTLACSMLESLGYQVLSAENPDRCIELVKNYLSTINLLLTDVVMPRMNGKDLYDRLHRMRPDLKVIFMSGYTSNVIGHHGVLDQGTHFIQKPFSIHTLSEKVRHVLDS
jgi:PAS domain S-box-containing protein